jgi:hypothetical protein
VRPLLSELQAHGAGVLAGRRRWQACVDRRKWRHVLKSTDIVWCYRDKKLDCLRGDTALTNRGPRQKDRGTRVAVAACTTRKLANSAAALPSEGRSPGSTGRV